MNNVESTKKPAWLAQFDQCAGERKWGPILGLSRRCVLNRVKEMGLIGNDEHDYYNKAFLKYPAFGSEVYKESVSYVIAK